MTIPQLKIPSDPKQPVAAGLYLDYRQTRAELKALRSKDLKRWAKSPCRAADPHRSAAAPAVRPLSKIRSSALTVQSSELRMKAAMIPYFLYSIIYKLGDKIAFSQIKEKLGTSFVAGISGGGSMSKDVEEFFSAIGIKLLDGYGLTETAPVIGLQRYPRSIQGYMQPFEGTEIKIIDPESGRELGIGEKGELLVRGPQVMKGYYNDPERTASVIDSDGFFHTGDLAIIEARGDFAIVGRVKDTIVLSGGENIEPVPIENAIKSSEYVDNVVIVGQDRRYLGALIVIDTKNVERYLKDSQVPYMNKADLTELDEVKHLIDGEVQRLVSRAAGFKPYEQVPRFVLLSKPFQVGRELSAKQEVKRSEIQKLYRDEIESIFA